MEIGKTVVCIDASNKGIHQIPIPLIEGEIYKALNVKECQCGRIWIDVGIKAPDNAMVQRCPSCKMLHKAHKVWWFMQERFRDIDEQFGQEVCEKIEEDHINELCQTVFKRIFEEESINLNKNENEIIKKDKKKV